MSLVIQNNLKDASYVNILTMNQNPFHHRSDKIGNASVVINICDVEAYFSEDFYPSNHFTSVHFHFLNSICKKECKYGKTKREKVTYQKKY